MPPLERRFRPLRAAVANLRAAAETLEAYPEMEIVRRTRLLQVMVEEAQRLATALVQLEASLLAPRNADDASVPLGDLLTAIDRELAAAGVEFETAARPDGPGAMIAAPADPLARALARFAEGLQSHGAGRLRLGVGALERHLRLDLEWLLSEATADAAGWALGALESEPADPAAGPGLRVTLRAHGGEAWLALERDASAAHLRVILPMAVAGT